MKKNCLQCHASFEIFPEDLKFYDTVSPVFGGVKYPIPEPTLCALCRMQRRLSYRNERFLYHRKSDLSGKQMISSFSSDKPFPVYDVDEWWSEEWDALKFGREFDFSRPFFEQFFELRNLVPRLARQHQKPMENSDYCNCASHNKNCYLVFSTNYCEDCYYGSWVNKSKNCLDNTNILDCELCYECVGCWNCYNLRYCQDSTNCRDSFFLRGCSGCSDCFGCFNLVQKQYCVFNEQKTKEEYEAFLKNIDRGSFSEMSAWKEKFEKFSEGLIVKAVQGVHNESSSGNYLQNCKDAFLSFECDNCENVRYCMCLDSAKNSMDYSYWGGNSEWMYECQACGYDLQMLRFCNLCWSNCSDLLYCDHCFSSRNCFGCVGLKKQEYYILNKQYTKEEYEKLVPKIISHMKSTGEFGEFFPIAQSIYAYNETLANEQIPLSREEILARGWQWHEEENTQYVGAPFLIPDRIYDVTPEISKQVLQSSLSGKPYKIIPQEFQFYKEQDIPIPRLTPDERHFERLSKRNKRVLYDRACAKCARAVKTTYAPERKEVIYCGECFVKTVY